MHTKVSVIISISLSMCVFVCICVCLSVHKYKNIIKKNKACKEYAIVEFTSSLLCIVLLWAIIQFQFLFSFLLALSFL